MAWLIIIGSVGLLIGWLLQKKPRTSNHLGMFPVPKKTQPDIKYDWSDNEVALGALHTLQATSKPLFITGSAGTGKTSLLRTWRNESSPVVLAPTGIAALHAGGSTIHSFFGFKLGLLRKEEIMRMDPPSRTPLNKLKTLVIDEVSMVRADVMAAIELRLKMHGPNPGQPFGGVRIVLVGDLLQLPPVIDEDLKGYFARNRTGKGYASGWWWESREAGNTKWTVVELLQAYRQVDPTFIAMLQRARVGRLEKNDFDWLNERVTTADENVIRLTATNKKADQWNETRLASILGKPTIYRAYVQGEPRELNQVRWPAPDSLSLKQNARVVFVQNDPGKRWVNGDTGTVLRCSREEVRVRMDRQEQAEYDVQRAKWSMKGYRYDEEAQDWLEYDKATFEQLPLNLGWARTIHKSQGQTYERVHVDLGRGAFAAGMTYVALSRVRTPQGLTIERPVQASDVFVDPDALRWLKIRLDHP